MDLNSETLFCQCRVIANEKGSGEIACRKMPDRTAGHAPPMRFFIGKQRRSLRLGINDFEVAFADYVQSRRQIFRQLR